MRKDILKGKRIAITAIDLEQTEHRGLASLSKSLIELLVKYGAEVYLITSINSFRLNKIYKKIISKKLKNEIFIADICDKLEKGTSYREKFKSNKLYKIKLILKLFIRLFSLNFSNYYLKKEFFNLSEIHKELNIHSSRMDYLKNINGFIYVSEVFNLSRLRSMRLIFKCPKLKLSKKDIDLIITSCPLSLVNKDSKSANIVQIIPDAIPIQVSSHPENPVTFYNRLSDDHLSKTFYISEATRSSVRDILGLENTVKDSNDILYPMPSIELKKLSESLSLKSIREIDNPFILFNSSIVERKRVELSIKYFCASKLPERGFKFLIAGKIHNSEYCKKIKNICKNNKSVILLNYVSEIEKVWLFLNSSLLISTSSSEGFGIPVLDATCLNLPVLASNIKSHQEIKNLINSENITLNNIKDENCWINYLNDLLTFDKDNEKSKFLRIEHFKKSLRILEDEAASKILNQIKT